MTIEEYQSEKLKIFKQLDIKLTKAEKEHLKTLESEIKIDNYCHSLIVAKL